MEKAYTIFELGSPGAWKDNVTINRISGQPMVGRRFVDRDLPLVYFGVSVNSTAPGDGAGYWHSHSVLEELYLFLDGEGELALDGEVLRVGPGTAVRVGQGVQRTWRCLPSSPVPLRWICVRGGGAPRAEIGDDTTRGTLPLPWTIPDKSS